MEKVFISKGICKEKPDGEIVLVGSRCKSCGHTFFPAVTFCGHCLSKEMEEFELAKEGTLYSYTITRVPVSKYPIPHPLGFITIPESKVRITTPLYMDDEPYLKIGAKMKMEIDTFWEEEDKTVIGPKFRVVREDKQS